MAQQLDTTPEVREFLDDMIPRQEAADSALHNGDAGPRWHTWSQNDPCTILGAFGVVANGWDEMLKTFEWVASQFSNVEDFHLEIITAGVSGDMAYTVAYEHSRVSVNGEPPKPWKLRATHVYRRENGEWRVCHRHGDQLDTDQVPAINQA